MEESMSYFVGKKEFFPGIPAIQFEGRDSRNPLSFKFYDREKRVLGKTMHDHLRFAVCYWHTFCAAGSDQFGDGTRTYPWDSGATPMDCAKQKLDAAGYALDASGARLDKEGKPISLRLYFPDSDELYATTAQFVQDWYEQLGIKVTAQAFDSTTLGNIILPPEACEEPNCAEYKADYDIELWGWAWGPDPNNAMQVFLCEAIGSSSDSQYCNARFDELYAQQAAAQTDEERKAILTEMQNILYDEAVYDILFYDANLAAYRTDRFAGWQNQPLENGTPFFTYSTLQYTMLTDATAEPSPTPEQSAEPGATAAPVASPAPTGDEGGDNTLLLATSLLGAVIVVGGVVLAMVFRRRSGGGGPAAEEE